MPKLFDTRDLLIRHLLIVLMALFFSWLSTQTQTGVNAERMNVGWEMVFLWNFLFIAFIWNGNIALIQYSPYPVWKWETEAFKKISLTVIIALFWPVLVNYVFNVFVFPIIMQRPCDLGAKENIIFLIISVTITLFINTIFVAIEFFSYWRESIKEKEALKRYTLAAEFESLKNQVNPHFLFNALNTLSSLIDEDQRLANQFVQQLASVYRYLLSQTEKETVSLGEELAFLKSYVFLNQIRFGENLKVEMQIAPELWHKNIITLTLQMLLENAIKHNVISKEKPLHILIVAEGNSLCVGNNLQLKTQVAPSTGIGLENIQSRYKLFTQEQMHITQTDARFEVCVPLI